MTNILYGDTLVLQLANSNPPIYAALPEDQPVNISIGNIQQQIYILPITSNLKNAIQFSIVRVSGCENSVCDGDEISLDYMGIGQSQLMVSSGSQVGMVDLSSVATDIPWAISNQFKIISDPFNAESFGKPLIYGSTFSLISSNGLCCIGFAVDNTLGLSQSGSLESMLVFKKVQSTLLDSTPSNKSEFLPQELISQTPNKLNLLPQELVPHLQEKFTSNKQKKKIWGWILVVILLIILAYQLRKLNIQH